jgi:hypothetical protein
MMLTMAWNMSSFHLIEMILLVENYSAPYFAFNPASICRGLMPEGGHPFVTYAHIFR